MQPTMVITAPSPGMIYINGHFAGETDADQPLMRPFRPTGAVYLEYRPFDSALRSLAHRLVFSGGSPLANTLEKHENLRVVVWPGGITEIELAPPQNVPPAPIVFEAAGRSFVIDSRRRLMNGSEVLAQLPAGAEIPEYRMLTHGAALTGKCSEGMYLLAGDGPFSQVLGFLQARQIVLEPDGRIQALADRGDLVGHAALENWRLGAEGLELLSSEPVWASGSPNWPQTAPDTVRAAVEAELEGLRAEAEGYLSPALRLNSPLGEIAGDCDLCVEMKYAVPDGRPCVGLLRLDGPCLARVKPLYYHVSPSGGAQGPYQIESLSL